MTNQSRPAGFVVAVILFSAALAGQLMGQTASLALTGKVTSVPEGPMEGVLVGARKAGSTIATWVVTNAQGDYRFPRERMEPGEYTIRVRAVGYKLPATSVDVAAHGTKLDLQLQKVTRATELGMQLSNTEWLMSVPSTQAQKAFLSGCVNCHTLQRVMFSRFDA